MNTKKVKIESLNLRTRTFNLLRRTGIKTLNELYSYQKTNTLHMLNGLSTSELMELNDVLRNPKQYVTQQYSKIEKAIMVLCVLCIILGSTLLVLLNTH